jgi:hypothetical protein
MNGWTNFTAALLVLMNLVILIAVIGFLLFALGVVPRRRRYVAINIAAGPPTDAYHPSRPGAVVALDQSRGTPTRHIIQDRAQEEAA